MEPRATLSLRRAGPADLDVVMDLEEAGFEAGIVESRAVFARRIAAFPEGFLLASEGTGEVPWGYFCCEIWSGWDHQDRSEAGLTRFDLGHDIGSWLDRRGDTLYIASMTVAPSARRGGRGGLLFQAGLDQMTRDFPELRRAVLIVNEHWTGARHIYLGAGFLELGRLPGFFQPLAGPVGDAVLMVRSV